MLLCLFPRALAPLGAKRSGRLAAIALLFAGLLGALSTPATLRADDAEPEVYRAVIQEALAERNLGHYQESRALFAKAHALLPSARTLRGLGLSDYDLRNYTACVRNLEAALASPVRPLDGALRAEVEDVLAHAYNFVGRYRMHVEPSSARLSVDDVDQSSDANGETLLEPGEHRIRIHAAGYETLQTRLSVSGGEQEQLSFALVPESAPASAPARAEEERARPWYKRAWVWTAVGVVLAGAAAGVAVAATRDGTDPELPAYGGTSNVVIDAR